MALPIVRCTVFALLFISAGTASAQWLPNAWTSGPIYFTGGSVAIGTSDSSLQNGDVGLVLSGDTPSLRMISTQLFLHGPTDPPACGDYELGTTPGGFAIFDGCALTPRLSIDPTGIVTVGQLSTSNVNTQNLSLQTDSALLHVNDTRSYASGVGGRIAFGGYVSSSQSVFRDLASIAGIKENGTNLDTSSALLFSTFAPGETGLTERMRIGSTGLVTIGPVGGTSTKLIVNGVVQSASGGFKFPDGTVQTTASSGGGSSQWGNGTSGAIYYSSGNVGLGTSSPQSAFHISRAVATTTDYLLRLDNAASANNPAMLMTYGGGKSLLSLAGTNGGALASDGSLWFATSSNLDANNPSNVRMSVASNGNVGIGLGTAAATHVFDVSGTPLTNGAASELFGLYDARSFAAGVGGGIAFGGKYNAAGTSSQTFGAIQGIKENATDGDYASAMLFLTRQNGSTPAERLRIGSDGLVTIGTGSSSSTKLAVNGLAQVNGIVQSTTGGFKFPDGTTQTTAASSGGSSQWTNGTSGSIFYSGGNVGIGSATNPPPYRLTVAGGHIAVDNGFQLISRNGAGSGYFRLIGADPSDHILIGDNTGTFANEIRFQTTANGTPSPASAVIATNGNFGIGTAADALPSARLEVSKASTDATLRQEVARITRSGGSSTTATALRSALVSFYDGANGTLTAAVGGYRGNANNDYNGGLQFFVNNTGAAAAANVSQLTAAMTIDNTGHVEVPGDFHAGGNISGGTVYATYQDVAEWVPASGNLPSGTVVILNRARKNEVMPSSTPYDTAVAGVVSEKPGLLLGKGNAGDAKIATTGRVKVRVDAGQHPIAIGDLLVTSEKPGVAMFSEPVDLGGVKIHRPGTIIGKALEPLPDGEGEILVLLSLQ